MPGAAHGQTVGRCPRSRRAMTLDDLLGTAVAWRDIDPDPDDPGRARRADRPGAGAGGPERAGPRWPSGSPAGSAFGTAGLRGELGAGPMRMNRVVVRQAAAGLARWLPAPASTVVIGFDARHRSDVFAGDSARVLAAAGRRALLFPAVVPDAGAGLRRAPPRRRCRGHVHGQPQPAARQRLQGLPRRRRPDHPAGRRRDRGRHRRGPAAGPIELAADDDPGDRAGRRRGGRRPTSTHVVGAAWPPGPRRPAHRLHADARRRRRRSRSRRSRRAGFTDVHVVAEPGRARPRLPDRRLPEPRGAGRARPGRGAGPARSAPTS